MSRSYSEKAPIPCSACGEEFEVEVWFIVDASERPDLREALLSQQLNVVSCPHCGQKGLVDVPILYHDPDHEFVFFALPTEGLEEDEARLRSLITTALAFLLQSIPEEERKPYLNTVRVVRGMPALATAVKRAEAEFEAQKEM